MDPQQQQQHYPSQNQPPQPQPPAPWPPQTPPADSAQWQRPVEVPPASPYQPTTYSTPPPTTTAPAPVVQQTDDSHNYNHRSHLNLSKGEVLLREIKRHPIGVLQIYFVAGMVLLALLVGGGALIRYLSAAPKDGIITADAFPFPVSLITWLCFGLGLLTVVISAIAIRVYNGNRLYLTNEAVIQRIQVSLFHTKEQQISLGNIEDVSYEQGGIIPHMFHYGTIRMSTEGEETTYFFRFAANPKEQVFHIVNAQEAFNRLNPDPHR